MLLLANKYPWLVVALLIYLPFAIIYYKIKDSKDDSNNGS